MVILWGAQEEGKRSFVPFACALIWGLPGPPGQATPPSLPSGKSWVPFGSHSALSICPGQERNHDCNWAGSDPLVASLDQRSHCGVIFPSTCVPALTSATLGHLEEVWWPSKTLWWPWGQTQSSGDDLMNTLGWSKAALHEICGLSAGFKRKNQCGKR